MDALKFPSLYLLSQRILGAKYARKRCIDQHLALARVGIKKLVLVDKAKGSLEVPSASLHLQESILVGVPARWNFLNGSLNDEIASIWRKRKPARASRSPWGTGGKASAEVDRGRP